MCGFALGKQKVGAQKRQCHSCQEPSSSQGDNEGQIIETPEQLFRRVARRIAAAEIPWGGQSAASNWEETFYELLASLDFLPNSPTLMNAGTALGQLIACFVLPVGDSMVEIFDALTLGMPGDECGDGSDHRLGQARRTDSRGGAAAGQCDRSRPLAGAADPKDRPRESKNRAGSDGLC
jgi:ribonucleoside-diphosphate reductase alpha chain